MKVPIPRLSEKIAYQPSLCAGTSVLPLEYQKRTVMDTEFNPRLNFLRFGEAAELLHESYYISYISPSENIPSGCGYKCVLLNASNNYKLGYAALY